MHKSDLMKKRTDEELEKCMESIEEYIDYAALVVQKLMDTSRVISKKYKEKNFFISPEILFLSLKEMVLMLMGHAMTEEDMAQTRDKKVIE